MDHLFKNFRFSDDSELFKPLSKSVETEKPKRIVITCPKEFKEDLLSAIDRRYAFCGSRDDDAVYVGYQFVDDIDLARFVTNLRESEILHKLSSINPPLDSFPVFVV